MLGLGTGVNKLSSAEAASIASRSGGYLLDTYSGAAAAYSLRQLSSSYSGNAVKVRRSSDNTETDIGFVGGELDTASLSSFAGAGDAFVVSWFDQSGNSKNATQTTTARQPQIVSSGAVIVENGKPAIYFENQTRTLASSLGSNSITTCDFVGVNRRVSGTGYVYFWYQTSFQVTQYDSTNYSLGWGKGTATTADTLQHLDYHIASNGTGLIRRDGTASTSGGLSTARHFSGSFAFNNRPGFATYNAPEIYHQEFIIWNSNQSAGNRTGIESNINTFYSIY